MKKITAVFLTFTMVFSIVGMLSLITTAEETQNTVNSDQKETYYNSTDSYLESLFEENNTNAIELFENQITKYESMRNDDIETNERIDALILKTNQFINDYINYSSSRQPTRGRSSLP